MIPTFWYFETHKNAHCPCSFDQKVCLSQGRALYEKEYGDFKGIKNEEFGRVQAYFSIKFDLKNADDHNKAILQVFCSLYGLACERLGRGEGMISST